MQVERFAASGAPLRPLQQRQPLHCVCAGPSVAVRSARASLRPWASDRAIVDAVPTAVGQLEGKRVEAIGLAGLQIRLLELPKYDPPGDNSEIVDPLEKWACLFRRASESTAEELTERLADPVFAEATGVLEIIASAAVESTAG